MRSGIEENEMVFIDKVMELMRVFGTNRWNDA